MNNNRRYFLDVNIIILINAMYVALIKLTAINILFIKLLLSFHATIFLFLS